MRDAKQADAIRKWKPWEKSTGPRSASGKAKSKMNALKEGAHNEKMRKFRKVLNNQIRWLKCLR